VLQTLEVGRDNDVTPPIARRNDSYFPITGVSKNAKIPFDKLRVSGKVLPKWISNRSG
jgi:hypothetical protein